MRPIQRLGRPRTDPPPNASWSAAASAGAGAVFLWVGVAPRFEILRWRTAAAACLNDLLLGLALFLAHLLLRRIAGARRRGRRRVDSVFLVLYLALALTAFANAWMMAATGSFFEFGFLARITASDLGTILPAAIPFLADVQHVLLAGTLPVAVLAAWAARRGWPAVTSLAVLTAAGAAVSAQMAAQPEIARVIPAFSVNPVLAFVSRSLRPSRDVRALRGDDPLRTRIGNGDWALLPAQPPHLGRPRGSNLLLITVDTATASQWGRDAVLAHADAYPNLAALYRAGIAFPNFYANVPLSAMAQQAIMNALYPSQFFSMRTSADFPTLSGELARNGYVAAHMMSGRLDFLGVEDFLRGRGFARVEDSRSLPCTPAERSLIPRYGHAGDDCTVREAMRWLAEERRRPFFLWVWLSGAHIPYFTGSNRPETEISREAHGLALRRIDAGIGRLMAALDSAGVRESTTVVVLGDHGEAFGEHGMRAHATSVYEEQVHTMLVVAPPHAPRGTVNPVLGSMVDVAPTLLDLVGLASPAGWQGHSLFAPGRPPRVYFRSLYGGRSAGFSDGRSKIVLNEFGGLHAYDLRSDPSESRPLPRSPAQAAAARARIAAFIDYNRKLTWPTRPAS